MGKKTEFRAVEFVRKVRDEQAAMLAGKSPEEIIAFFAAASARLPRPAARPKGARRSAARR